MSPVKWMLIMERGKITVFAVITAVLITAAVLLAFLFMDLGTDTADVNFPEAVITDGSGTGGGGSNPGSELTFARISPETVQTAIKTIKRPESYSRSLEIESFWEGGEEKFTVMVWSKGEKQRLKISAENWSQAKNILINEDSLYLWYGENSSSYKKLKRDGVLSGNSIYDAFQMIPTYEDVLELDVSEIISADYVERDGGWRIKVTAEDRIMGYTEIYFISIETGLLEAAETYDGDTLIFKMTAGEAELSAPEDSLFVIE
jgi:hypothetical protein